MPHPTASTEWGPEKSIFLGSKQTCRAEDYRRHRVASRAILYKIDAPFFPNLWMASWTIIEALWMIKKGPGTSQRLISHVDNVWVCSISGDCQAQIWPTRKFRQTLKEAGAFDLAEVIISTGALLSPPKVYPQCLDIYKVRYWCTRKALSPGARGRQI